MNIMAEIPDDAADLLMAAMQAIGVTIPAGWVEPFEDFEMFLEDCGFHVGELPAWSPAAAIQVVSAPPRLWIRRVNRAERRRHERMLAKGKAGLAITPLDELNAPPWVQLNITGIDSEKAESRRRYV
jgi:hypothetical protein